MKKLILGTTSYRDKMISKELDLFEQGHDVRLPFFDDCEHDALSLCECNRALIEWADEIHVYWDNRSVGFIFDMGMIFMARKPIVIEYIESKTLEQVIRGYAQQMTLAPV